CVPGTLVRVSPFVRPVWDPGNGTWIPPGGLSEAEFRALADMPLDSLVRSDLDLLAKITELWLADRIPNQPVRIGERMSCDIGHDTFSQALAHWRKIE